MTQQDIQELEKKAIAGDQAAQFSFGRLLVVNNYYEAGKDFIVKASEQQNEDAVKWIALHQKLTKALETVDISESMEGKKLNLWNVKEGEGKDIFSFSSLTDESIIIFIDKSDGPIKHFHTELISEKYFHILFDLWEAYLNGVIKIKDIKPTKNAKYLISILHYILENNPELQKEISNDSK